MRIYVRLLDEGSSAARPTEGEPLGNGLFRILPTADYDPEDEHWEFAPYCIVRCESRRDQEGPEYLLAIENISK